MKCASLHLVNAQRAQRRLSVACLYLCGVACVCCVCCMCGGCVCCVCGVVLRRCLACRLCVWGGVVGTRGCSFVAPLGGRGGAIPQKIDFNLFHLNLSNPTVSASCGLPFLLWPVLPLPFPKVIFHLGHASRLPGLAPGHQHEGGRGDADLPCISHEFRERDRPSQFFVLRLTENRPKIGFRQNGLNFLHVLRFVTRVL